ncbi:MAG: ABC transporter substrate-binding protein [Acidimicrobiia bacterium]
MRATSFLAIAAFVAGACGGGATSSPPASSATSASAPASASASASASPSASTAAASCEGATPNAFFDRATCEKQLAQRSATPTGPADQPWIQAIDPQMVDTSKYKKAGPYKICFSNAGVNNPWRVVGYNTMQHEVKLQTDITNFVHVDAGGDDNKQISDLADMVKSGNCDAIIVAPNSTAALTPAVEAACASGTPIIVFDRGVTTSCPVTFIHPIGGYAFGADAAEFLAANVKPGAGVIALRILPGVDVLETRWLAAEAIFKQHNLTVLASEQTGGDAAKTKSIVSDAIDKYGTIDGVWMDAGATSVAAAEAFVDKGLPVPPITGEDQNDFLQAWKTNNWTAVAPTYPTYQWRTAVIAAVMILKGQQVPKEWVLPQPKITKANLDQYIYPGMPPLFYALCGCQSMPGFPEDWQK